MISAISQITGRGTGSVNASTTVYRAIGAGFPGAANTGAEADKAQTCRIATRYTNLGVLVWSNDRGASTYKFRKNTANGNQSIPITAATPGFYQDNTNSDTVAAGDTIAVQLVTGSGGTTFVDQVFTNTAGISVHQVLVSSQGFSTSTASQNNFTACMGTCQTSTTEANVQFTNRAYGAFQNLQVLVSANGRASNSSAALRIGGSDTALVVTITGSTPGSYEDTTHTVTSNYGDVISQRITTGTGTGTLTTTLIRTTFIPLGNTWMQGCADDGAGTIATGTTGYIPLGGQLLEGTTESRVQMKAGVNGYLTNLQIRVQSNGISATTTFDLRLGAASSALTIAVTASTPGVYENNTDGVMVVPTDLLNYRIVTGGTGTNLSRNTCGVFFHGISSIPAVGAGQ